MGVPREAKAVQGGKVEHDDVRVSLHALSPRRGGHNGHERGTFAVLHHIFVSYKLGCNSVDDIVTSLSLFIFRLICLYIFKNEFF